jgi:hypothetical protein
MAVLPVVCTLIVALATPGTWRLRGRCHVKEDAAARATRMRRISTRTRIHVHAVEVVGQIVHGTASVAATTTVGVLRSLVLLHCRAKVRVLTRSGAYTVKSAVDVAIDILTLALVHALEILRRAETIVVQAPTTIKMAGAPIPSWMGR